MIAALHFITLVVTTMFAAAAAVFVNWVLLRGAFLLMRPRLRAEPLAKPRKAFRAARRAEYISFPEQ